MACPQERGGESFNAVMSGSCGGGASPWVTLSWNEGLEPERGVEREAVHVGITLFQLVSPKRGENCMLREIWWELLVCPSPSCRAELADTNFMLSPESRLVSTLSNRALTLYRDAQRSETVARDGAGDGLEKSFEHTHFADTNPHVHRSQRASGRKIRPFTATKVPFTATTNATRTASDSSSGGYLLYILDTRTHTHTHTRTHAHTHTRTRVTRTRTHTQTHILVHTRAA